MTNAHVLAAAMEFLEMDKLDGVPSSDIIPDGSWLCPKEEKQHLLLAVSRSIVDKHVNIKAVNVTSNDNIKAYASEAVSLGLFHEEFHDSIREGDGERVLRCWKFLLLLFKATQHKNYSLEALRLLLQFEFLLPQRQAQQLLHSRFVNTRGLLGHNVSCDLHMEHLNRLCKAAVGGLGANKVETAIVRVGKCIQTVSEVLDRFDRVLGCKKDSSTHAHQSETKDLQRILKTLTDASF